MAPPKDKDVQDDEPRPSRPSPIEQVQKVDAERYANKELEERRVIERKQRDDD
ncbi:MAG: hypothetical protein M3Q27_00705 [Actinomycetota bacterium]|nr:hypothetical protein [Actinomycetota bacterium]